MRKTKGTLQAIFPSYSYYYTLDTIVHEPSDEVTDEAFFHSLPWFTLLLHFFLTLFALMLYSRRVFFSLPKPQIPIAKYLWWTTIDPPLSTFTLI